MNFINHKKKVEVLKKADQKRTLNVCMYRSNVYNGELLSLGVSLFMACKGCFHMNGCQRHSKESPLLLEPYTSTTYYSNTPIDTQCVCSSSIYNDGTDTINTHPAKLQRILQNVCVWFKACNMYQLISRCETN